MRPEPSASGSDARRILLLLVLAVVGFAFQQTAIVPAVQTVQRSLHGSREWSAWLVTVYLIVATVATPAMGRLADLYGRRRLLLIGLLVFLAGSVAAAFAPSLPALLCCRAVQGVGGSVYPLCLALARQSLDDQRVTAGVAVLAGAFGLGTAAGFLAGGFLAEYASWRWIFGAGAVVIAVSTLVVPRLPDDDERAGGSFDLPGTAVLSAAVVGLLIALTLVVSQGWASPITAGLLAVALVAAVAWWRIEATRSDPLVDVHVVRQPRVAVVNLATIGLGWALFSSYLLIPLFVQHSGGFGLASGAATTGLVLLPLAVAQTIAGPGAGWLAPRLGARIVFCAGLVAVAVALALLTFVQHSAAALAGCAALLGVGAGLALQASSSVATQGVEPDVAAVSSAVNSTVRRLAGGVGGQVSTMLLVVPSRSALVAAYGVAATLSLLGSVLIGAYPIMLRRDRPRRPRDRSAT